MNNVDHIGKIIFATVSAVFTMFGAFAATETVGDYTWTYARDGSGVKITAVSPAPSGTLTIPAKLGGLNVVNIVWSEDDDWDSNIDTVIIPGTVADSFVNEIPANPKGMVSVYLDDYSATLKP